MNSTDQIYVIVCIKNILKYVIVCVILKCFSSYVKLSSCEEMATLCRRKLYKKFHQYCLLTQFWSHVTRTNRNKCRKTVKIAKCKIPLCQSCVSTHRFLSVRESLSLCLKAESRNISRLRICNIHRHSAYDFTSFVSPSFISLRTHFFSSRQTDERMRGTEYYSGHGTRGLSTKWLSEKALAFVVEWAPRRCFELRGNHVDENIVPLSVNYISGTEIYDKELTEYSGMLSEAAIL